MIRSRLLLPGLLVLCAIACEGAETADDASTEASSGASTSGASTSGASTGGESTGGASTGGASTGGDSTGGGSASSSAASGGAGAGGAGAAGGGEGTGASHGDGGAGPVDLPAGVSALFPTPGARGLCPDPPLRITFPGAPKLGSAGSVRVFNAARPGAAVATVDMSSMTVSATIGGRTFNVPRPVYVDGNDAVVSLPSRALDYGQSYYVTVDAGAIVPPGGGSFAIADATTWRFDTAAAGPSSVSSLEVALDGSGDFCSLQGALDAVPANNRESVLITVQRGVHHGVVYFENKHNITLRGADRKGTVLSGTNNNNLNPSTRGRALVGADKVSGLVIENLTIHNLTPQGGSQAEALRIQDCDKCIVRNADILSLQDTLLWSGRIYADNCTIAGNVDFVWGTGAAYFNRCEIKTVGRSGYNVQARNGDSGYGYVFVDSRITSDAGITGNTLARIDVSQYPASHVAYIGCTLGSHISRAGWTITGGAPPRTLRFWEYQSRDTEGRLIDTSGRIAGSTQISAAQAAMMRDPSVVLGGWVPPG
ncbi:pectinesterase family protein [Sorangium sp. So ce1000]|uniref:pectinesterase family protein n=1 Tax=Sorangium sp. So ce1000 TaxID=3133325 RepID=UPI003F5E4A5F